MTREEFVDKLHSIGVEISKEQEEQYYLYASLLKEWNAKMNLTGIDEEPAVLEMHFYDSIVPFARLGIKSGNFADVGAGAGFPSIPVLIAFKDFRVTIIEPLQKRCNFLNEVKNQLHLDNLEIVNGRAEDFANEHRESFDIVSARAVANLNMLSELCIPLVKMDGIFLAMKGNSGLEENDHAKKAIATLGAEFVRAYEEPVGEHTHINLVYKKIKHTPKQYPRAFAKIKKSPL